MINQRYNISFLHYVHKTGTTKHKVQKRKNKLTRHAPVNQSPRGGEKNDKGLQQAKPQKLKNIFAQNAQTEFVQIS